MSTRPASQWARSVAALGVAAVVTVAGAITTAAPAHADWNSGQGFVLLDSTVRDRPAYDQVLEQQC